MFKKIKTEIWKIPFHPLAWAVYPVLALYLSNFEQVPFYAVVQSIIFIVLLTIIIFLLSYSSLVLFEALSSWKLVAQMTILVILLASLYFGLYKLLDNSPMKEMARHRYLFPLWGVVFLVCVLFILKPASIAQRLRNPSIVERAAAITSLILVLFILYGHISGLISAGSGFIKIMAIHRRLMLIWALLLAGGGIFIVRIKNISGVTKGINVTVSILLAMALFQTIFVAIQSSNKQVAELPTAPASESSSNDPDVYYILLDAYSREDLLRETLDFDNSPFVNELKSMGFVLPECTQSNYHVTLLSLTSTLNMNYLDKLGPDQQGLSNYYDYTPYYQHNSVMKIFEEKGYETYTFRGQYLPINIPDATHFYDLFAGDSGARQIETQNFYYIFLQTTAVRPILDYVERHPQALDNLPKDFQGLLPTEDMFSGRYYKQYQQSLYHLDVLKQIPEMPGKKFVYAHLYITHEPYVFTPDGLFRWPPTGDAAAYQDQVLFINDRLIPILKTIIARSERPPIIVVQGDHGWQWDERRNRILNAYFLPDGGDAQLYPEITPVNTFRLILNEYFGANYELLPDVSYYANVKNEDTDKLILAPNTCIQP